MFKREVPSPGPKQEKFSTFRTFWQEERKSCSCFFLLLQAKFPNSEQFVFFKGPVLLKRVA
jgi:hypothetical protein